MNRRPLTALLALVILIAVAGCSPAEEPDAGSAKTPAVVVGTPDPEPQAEPGTTPEEPLPLGRPTQVGEWEVAVTEASLDASQAVAAAGEFNNPPGAGNRYVMVTLRGTYRGTTSGTLWIDLLYSFRTATGNRHNGTVSFAVPPNPISEAGETAPDGEVSGTILFEVPADQVPGGVLLIEDFMAVEGGQYYFALE